MAQLEFKSRPVDISWNNFTLPSCICSLPALETILLQVSYLLMFCFPCSSDDGLQRAGSETPAGHCVPVKVLITPDQMAPSSLFPNSLLEGQRNPGRTMLHLHPGYATLVSWGRGHKAHLALNSDIFSHTLPSLACQRHGDQMP